MDKTVFISVSLQNCRVVLPMGVQACSMKKGQVDERHLCEC